MKILLVHNHYQRVGGEDETVADEEYLLRSHGHAVIKYEQHNDAIRDLGSLELGLKTLWNSAAYGELRQLIRRERPDVLHAHNLFPLISPAIYYAAGAEGVPVIQSLHNYRLLCVGGMLSRDGRPCEICTRKTLPWPGVWHRCYRDRAHSLAIAAMLTLHWGLRTWQRRVRTFIALTDFARSKLVQSGLPPEKIVVKPNFVPTDPGIGAGAGGYALYVGRLSPEKGIGTLFTAWQGLEGTPRLLVVGEGPMRPETPMPAHIEFLGQLPRAEVYRLMREASFVVVPSEVYETFGRVAVEAFAAGTPVLAAKIGALAEIVSDGRTGLVFAPGNPEDLRRKALSLFQMHDRLAAMRQQARDEFERKYTSELNYGMLLHIYEQARRNAPTTSGAACPHDGAEMLS
jgi:glycosyltransferase involved in cell wall biosynthesis